MKTTRPSFGCYLVAWFLAIFSAGNGRGEVPSALATAEALALNGAPPLRRTVLAFGGTEALPGLSVCHHLAFDGDSYGSEFLVPEIETRLLRRTAGEYTWLTPEGNWATVRELKYTHVSGELWRAVVVSARRVLVENSRRDKVITYQDGQIAEIRTKVGNIRYQRDERSCILWSKHDTGERRVATAWFDGDGYIRRLENGEEADVIDLVRTGPGRQLEAVVASGAKTILAMRYSDGLLTVYSDDRGTKHYSWGRSLFSELYVPAQVIPPAVRKDDYGEYETTTDFSQRIVTATMAEKGQLRLAAPFSCY